MVWGNRYPNHAFLAVQQGITLGLVNSTSMQALFLNDAAKETAFNRLQSMELERIPYPEFLQSFWAVVLPSFFAFLTVWFSSMAVIVGLVADMVSALTAPVRSCAHTPRATSSPSLTPARRPPCNRLHLTHDLRSTCHAQVIEKELKREISFCQRSPFARLQSVFHIEYCTDRPR
jgi:hypothetical protein